VSSTRIHRHRAPRMSPLAGAVLLAGLTLSGLPVPATAATPSLSNTPYGNLAEALHKSLYFYDAEKSGPARSMNRQPLEWRGDSEPVDAVIPLEANASGEDLALTGTNLPKALISQYRSLLDPDGNGTLDLSQGFHDAGDHVKFGLPQAYTATTLAWGVYEFKDAYVKTGAYDHIMEELYWFTDYFLKSTFRDKTGKVIAFNYMVGRGGVDHTYWGPPELQNFTRYPRSATFAYVGGDGWKAAPASDQAAETAAALALMSLLVEKDDPTYATRCLDTAKSLYTFARENRGLGNGDGFYPASSDADDLSLAAIWLYIATGTSGYVTDIIAKNEKGSPTGYLKAIITSTDSTWQNVWVHSWDSVWGGMFAKLAPAAQAVIPPEDLPTYWYYFRWNAEYWSGGAVRHTEANDSNYLNYSPGGFGVISSWGSARYNTAAQLQALVYRKYAAQDPNGGAAHGENLSRWALGQMNYIMGNNPLHRSYIVGFTAKETDTSVQHPHHRAAHGSSLNDMNYPATHRHILWGALAGGPDSTDNHKDITADYVYNEVAIDYNAAFVGALAGLYTYFGADQKTTVWTPPAEAPTTVYSIKSVSEQESAQRSQITVQLNQFSVHPPSFQGGLSARYYFDISELVDAGQDIRAVKVAKYYDQSSLAQQSATVSDPVAVDAERGLYYVTISWDAPMYGTLDLQFGIIAEQGSDWAGHWDPTNDYSHTGISTTALDDTSYIPLYKDGVLVYGKEPSLASLTTTRPSTPTRTTSTTPTGTCTATYTPGSTWGGGYEAKILVKNTGTTPLKNWKVTWTPAAGQTLTQVWNGTLTASTPQIVIASTGKDKALASGGTFEVGLMGSSTEAPGTPVISCQAT
jgi:endoglucanase